jgi:hypothetical protein
MLVQLNPPSPRPALPHCVSFRVTRTLSLYDLSFSSTSADLGTSLLLEGHPDVLNHPCLSTFHSSPFILLPSFFSLQAQVCGSAQYVDDIKLPADALVAALVMSTKPHAKVLRVDTSAAAAMPGVAGIFSGGLR